MYPYIVCLSCNFALGDKYTIYRKMLDEEIENYAKENGVQIEFVRKNPNINIVAGHILDKLYITKYCCRMHMQTCTMFTEYY